MPYNLLMPEEEHRSPRPSWLRPWLWQRRWWIALATLFILVWWLVPPLVYRHTGTGKDAKLKAITDTRTALLAGLIGAGALLTFWLNSRMYRITARTLEITEQGHITERYTKAIQQLGDTELAVRLGGIYALEQLARDSPERDHPTVVEVLSAFVREGSRRQGTPRPEQGTVHETIRTLPTGARESNAKGRPATDVQAALTVLGRLPQRPGIPRGDLSEAHLSGAQLTQANLSGAHLFGADLSRARLSGADLSGAQLSRAKLSSAHLSGAKLSSARLYKANLSGAPLLMANLHGAWLEGADLSGARLIEANLSGAQLSGADLSGARLEGVDLRETLGLTQVQLDTARGDWRTQLPEGLQRPDSWATGEASAPVSSELE
jgi:uncharacterized protein YjbI with pentapeptide repeats